MTAGKHISSATTPSSEEQLHVRVAWLYYMEGRTQGEIADLLQTNRLRINKIIAEARRSGLVTITLNSQLSPCIALEQELVEEFGLKAANIVPTPEDHTLIPALLGQAAAEFLAQQVNTNKIKGIGVGWGATLREMVRFMPSLKRPEIYVNSVLGGLTHGIEINTFDIAGSLAKQLNAQCAYLAAPIYAGSPQSREAIVRLDMFEEAFQRIEHNDIIIVSIGDMTDRSLLIRYGLPNDVKPEELTAKGAVGDIVAQFIDANGTPIDHQINQRAIAPSFDVLKKVPFVVIASGGLNKAEATAAMLLSGIGNVLICDELTARKAVEIARATRQNSTV